MISGNENPRGESVTVEPGANDRLLRLANGGNRPNLVWRGWEDQRRWHGADRQEVTPPFTWILAGADNGVTDGFITLKIYDMIWAMMCYLIMITFSHWSFESDLSFYPLARFAFYQSENIVLKYIFLRLQSLKKHLPQRMNLAFVMLLKNDMLSKRKF